MCCVCTNEQRKHCAVVRDLNSVSVVVVGVLIIYHNSDSNKINDGRINKHNFIYIYLYASLRLCLISQSLIRMMNAIKKCMYECKSGKKNNLRVMFEYIIS